MHLEANLVKSKMAVVPARGGSTRLIDKNIHLLGGKPLIRWTVEAILNSESFDTVVISTDSDKIYDAVSDLNVERHIRPPEDATEKATALSAMMNLMNQYERHDVFSYFLPTCPFVTSEEIKKGVQILSEDVDSVVSMTEYSECVQLACQMKEDSVLPFFDNLTSGLTNSKFIKKYYHPTGAFYISWWDKLLINKNFFIGDVKGIMMPKERFIDINDIWDFELAENYLKKQNKLTKV